MSNNKAMRQKQGRVMDILDYMDHHKSVTVYDVATSVYRTNSKPFMKSVVKDMLDAMTVTGQCVKLSDGSYSNK